MRSTAAFIGIRIHSEIGEKVRDRAAINQDVRNRDVEEVRCWDIGIGIGTRMSWPFVQCPIFVHIACAFLSAIQYENIGSAIALDGSLAVLMIVGLAAASVFTGNGDGMAGGIASQQDCGNRPEESRNGVLLVIARCRAAPSSWMILKASESDLGDSGSD